MIIFLATFSFVLIKYMLLYLNHHTQQNSYFISHLLGTGLHIDYHSDDAYLPTVQFLEGLSSFLRFQILKNWTVQFF